MKTLIVTYKNRKGMVVHGRTLMENSSGDASWLVFGKAPYPSPKGTGRVYSCEEDIFIDEKWADVVVEAVKKESPDLVLFPASPLGKALAPRVSALLSAGTTADAIEIRWEDGIPVAIRSAFGGNVLAKIKSRVKPHIVSMISVFPDESIPLNESSAERLFSEGDYKKSIRPVKGEQKENPLLQASVVIGVGRGIGTEENFKRVLALADRIGAAVGVTRPLVEYGWASEEMMIGQTGLTVRPRLYIALGISGAFQHTVGVKAARVVAVNRDPEAPIFSIADVKVVADVNDFIESLERKFLAS